MLKSLVRKVRKRDKRIVDFEQQKITEAIFKASNSVDRPDRRLAEKVSDEVVRVLNDKYANRTVDVESIQDVVEKSLIKTKNEDIARSYILYRRERTRLREMKQQLYGIYDDMKLPLNTVQVLAKRYLRRDDHSRIIETPRQMFGRIAKVVAAPEKKYKKSPKTAEKEFNEIMTSFEFVPNSPTIMNAGTSLGQLNACFVLPVEDSLESIFGTLKHMAIIHQSGGGTGFSFSRIRPRGDLVRSTMSVASGPISFMSIYDATTNVIKQGGRRRGANMGILRCDHPDIIEFVTSKTNGGLSNFNISVAATDKFMHAAMKGDDYNLINPRTKQVVKSVNAKEMFELIAVNAWKSGDPGLVFIDEINRTNPTSALGPIESTNPCVGGDTRVPTDKGLIKISELVGATVPVLTDIRTTVIEVNRELQLAKGVALRKATCWRTGIKKTLKMTTKSGYELIATPDHLMLTSNGWKRMDELKPGIDEVLIQSGAGRFKNSVDLPFSVANEFVGKNSRTYKLQLPKKWSKELGQILGWLVGDGWLCDKNKNRRVGFTFSEDDKVVYEHLGPIINAFYGRRIKPIVRENGVMHLSFHSKYFIDFFKKLGVGSWYSHNKKVPESIFTASEDAVIGFLQGLFTADGTVNILKDKSAYVRLSSVSEDLLKDVQLLLLNLGIFSKIYDRQRSPRCAFSYITTKGVLRVYHSSGKEYELEISRDAVPVFLKKIGFIGSKYAQKVKDLQNKDYYKVKHIDVVKSLADHEEIEVFDISEPVTHSFLANGIVVHNCGEQPLHPYESCTLGSINLSRFIDKGDVNWSRLRDVVRASVHFLDNVIDANRFPLAQIAEVTRSNRRIGLGIMGFADMLAELEIPYNSNEALRTGELMMKFINEEAGKKSVELGKERGSFPNFGKSQWKRHIKARRNATVTTIAPTGSISIIAGCSSGIEPFFAISFMRNVLEGTTLLETMSAFERVARERGFYSRDLMLKIARFGSIQKIAGIPKDVKDVFVTALDIEPEWHVKMQAAFQNHTENAVSKTVNLPYDATPEDVAEIYMQAYNLKCKGITVYRYGSKPEQVLYIGMIPGRAEEVAEERRVMVDSEFSGGCPSAQCTL